MWQSKPEMVENMESSIFLEDEAYWTIQSDVIATVTKTTDAAVSTDSLTVTGGNVIVETPGCILYSFVVSTVLIGCLCVFGVAGNTAAFIVFQKDKLKTSTSFLFQVYNQSDELQADSNNTIITFLNTNFSKL